MHRLQLRVHTISGHTCHSAACFYLTASLWVSCLLADSISDMTLFLMVCFYFNIRVFFSFLNFYCYSITVICLFSPFLHPTPAEPTSLPHLHPPPWFCPCVLYSSSCNPLSSLAPPHSPLTVVRLFFTSMSLVIYCFLFSSVDYVPVKGEIIWYLSLTTGLLHLAWCSPVPSMLWQRLGAPSFSLLHRIPLCKCTIVFWSIHLLMGT